MSFHSLTCRQLPVANRVFPRVQPHIFEPGDRVKYNSHGLHTFTPTRRGIVVATVVGYHGRYASENVLRIKWDTQKQLVTLEAEYLELAGGEAELRLEIERLRRRLEQQRNQMDYLVSRFEDVAADARSRITEGKH